MRPRYSLRTLLVLTTIVALACYWLMLPTIKAQKFVGAIASENYKLADSYFRDTDDQFLFEWNDRHWRFKAEAGLDQLTFRELMRGERSVRLHVAYGDAGPMRSGNWNVIATRSGLLEPTPAWSVGGFGGGGIL